MKKYIILLLLLVSRNIFADIPQESFAVFYEKSSHEIKLGDEILAVFRILGKVKSITKKYSNTVLNEYRYAGVTFSTRSGDESKEEEKSILSIEFTSSSVSLHDGITIGSSKKDILKKLGQPEDTIGDSCFFYNHEWDLLEMEINFDCKDIVERIRISLGT